MGHCVRFFTGILSLNSLNDLEVGHYYPVLQVKKLDPGSWAQTALNYIHSHQPRNRPSVLPSKLTFLRSSLHNAFSRTSFRADNLISLPASYQNQICVHPILLYVHLYVSDLLCVHSYFLLMRQRSCSSVFNPEPWISPIVACPSKPMMSLCLCLFCPQSLSQNWIVALVFIFLMSSY